MQNIMKIVQKINKHPFFFDWSTNRKELKNSKI